MSLNIDPDELNSCVQCGLCLPFCPTFRVTGDEALSPRGRIKLMREVQDEGAPLTPEVVESFETCVQCRGCEPACPSGVPYGHLIEQTRASLIDEGKINRRVHKAALLPLEHPVLLRAGSRLLAVAARAGLVPKRLSVPDDLPLTEEPIEASGDDVYLFTGCVMDAWQRDVHRATKRVIEAAGYGVTPTGDAAPCCGALHTHSGFTSDARRLARNVMDALDQDRPVLVDSAGCGAALKDYGRLLGTPEAAEFSKRVFDVSEWLAPRVDQLGRPEPLALRVAIQDPCHLRHVQRVEEHTRTVLRPFVAELVELDDDGLCCGAGGAYSVFEPDMAGQIRDRKLEAINRAAPDVVASSNPGCSMFLTAGGAKTLHPMELIDLALAG